MTPNDWLLVGILACFGVFCALTVSVGLLLGGCLVALRRRRSR